MGHFQLPQNCPECKQGYVSMTNNCTRCGYPSSDSYKFNKLLSELQEIKDILNKEKR